MIKKDKSPIVFYPITENPYKQSRLARYNFASRFVKDKVILEIGCGARDSALLLSKFAKRVIAIDISKEAIEFAKRNFAAENIKYLTMSCLDMEFQDSTFDMIISLEVIEHLSDEGLYLKNITRVIKSDGIYIGSTINRERNGLDPNFLKERHHTREYNLFEYSKIFKGYFRDVKIFGQFLKKDIDSGTKAFRDRIRRFDPFYIRRIIPNGFKEMILDFIRKINGAVPLKRISEEDFYFSDSNLTKAQNFVALCRR